MIVASDEATPAPGTIGPQSVPRIRRGFRLQWEAVQSAHVLLYPEGMVKLNRSAGEILTRCDGIRDIASITAELETSFGQPGLERDVQAFFVIARDQRWVEFP